MDNQNPSNPNSEDMKSPQSYHSFAKAISPALRNELYQFVIDAVSATIITFDEEASILHVDQSAQKLFGYEKEELLGKSFAVILPVRLREIYRKELKRFLATGKKSNSWQSIEQFGLHKFGHEIPVEISFGEHNFITDRKIFTAVIRDISERRKAQDALRKSEEYENLFKHANDAIVVFDPHTEEILDANDFACRLFGYERAEIVGETLALVYRDERERRNRTTKLLENGSIESYESIHYRKDGSPVCVSINSSLIEFSGKTAILSFKRDVTAKYEADRALRESENKLRMLIESMREGLIQLDNDDRIVFTNRRFCEMIGYTEHELLGQKASQLLLSSEEKKIVKKANQRRREGVSETYEIKLKTKGGDSIWSLVGAVPILDSEDNVIGSMSIHSDITERKRAEEMLRHNAMHDLLTGLPNRALFLEHLRRVINRSPLRKSNFAVLFLDFDGFKLINDSLGHAAGDELLRCIAQRLQSVIRANDVVARLGGDEFTILLDELLEPQDFINVVERIQSIFREPFQIEGREIFISASIGIALKDEKYLSPEDILRDADIAMYRAKSAGKARYEIFNQQMHEQITRRLQLETELRSAFEKNEFLVFYQPVVELATHEIMGFEALIRWQHPTHGLIMPGEFIPIAEETGVIVPIGEWVLEEACRQLCEWQARYPYNQSLTVSINLSCKQFTQLDLAERVRKILVRTGLNARSLRLEVTETHIMENNHLAVTIMNDLRNLGVRLSIDDFGTGYSSLSYLQRLPIDYLKIDRSFVGLLDSTQENREIVKAIVMLAKNLGMDVIAEGIETIAQAETLMNLECRFGQGYLYSKPTDAKAAENLLKTAFSPAKTAKPLSDN